MIRKLARILGPIVFILGLAGLVNLPDDLTKLGKTVEVLLMGVGKIDIVIILLVAGSLLMALGFGGGWVVSFWRKTFGPGYEFEPFTPRPLGPDASMGMLLNI